MFNSIISDIPPVTRMLCFSSVVLSYVTFIQLVQPANLYLNWKLTFSGQFEPWRMLTSILYVGQFDLGTFFKIYLLQRFSSRLEEQSFSGNAGHYVYFLLTSSTALIVVSLLLRQHSLSESFVVIILYVWSRKNQDLFIHVMGLLPLKAPYLTWFFMLMNIILGESIRSDVIGILIGHTYFFISDIMPKLPSFKGLEPLRTPKFMLDIFSGVQPRNRVAQDDEFF